MFESYFMIKKDFYHLTFKHYLVLVGFLTFAITQLRKFKFIGEVTSSELPPIEDLHISVPEIECSKVGTVSSCVHDLVVVQSLPGVPALNLVIPYK